MHALKLPSGAYDFWGEELFLPENRAWFAGICDMQARADSPLDDERDRAFYAAKAAELRAI